MKEQKNRMFNDVDRANLPEYVCEDKEKEKIS